MNILKAVLLKLTSALMFSVMSAFVRYVSDVTPLGEVVFCRSFFAIIPVMLIYALVRAGRDVVTVMRRHWTTGLAGGALQFGSYAIAIWAMTLAPIAIVAALRETSVLFGAVIATVFLREPLRPPRIVAALMIVTGLALIRLY